MNTPQTQKLTEAVEYIARDSDPPEGWELIELHSLGDVRLGKTPRRTDYRNDGFHRIVKFRDLKSGSVDYSASKAAYVVDSPKALKGLRPLRAGDVLVTASAHSGDQIGKKCAYIDRLPKKEGNVFFVGELLGVSTDPDLAERKWAFLWFLSEDGLEEVQRAVAGVHLTSGRAQRIRIPLAPRAEQQRIVEKTEQLLAKVNLARAHLKDVPAILKRFRQSVLAAACSGRLTEDWREANGSSFEEDWHDAQLSDICASISDGDHQPPPKQPTGIPFLTIGNISSGRLDFSETRFVSKEYFAEIKPERKPRRGDVLYTVVGATIGIPVLVDVDRPFCFQRHIALLRASNVTTPEFLWMFMASPEVFNEAWSRVTGSAQPTLPLGNLRTIPIRVPPLAEQEEIVRRVEALFKLADAIEKRVVAATVRAEKLTQAILAKAFRGELVPIEAELARLEGRSYEPASVLFDRIRASRAKQDKREGARSRKPNRDGRADKI